MININIEAVTSFLEKNPLMSLMPSDKDNFKIEGKLVLKIKTGPYGELHDEFLIGIVIPKNFPNELPVVYEIGNRFPKDVNFHVFEDGSLCLGSPLSLKKRLKEDPTIEGYVQNCIVPYFYAISFKLQGKDDFAFGELSHGVVGLYEDYLEIFELQYIEQVLQLLEILSKKKNKSNKMKCPCGCHRIVTRCSMHKKILEYRGVLTRRDYENYKKFLLEIYKVILQKEQKRREIKTIIPYL